MPRPRTLEITTNVGCKIACSYCPQGRLIKAYKARTQRSPSERVMSLRSLQRYLESVPSAVDIHFSGFAEPWHAPECTEMVLHTHSRGHRIAVFTTCDGLASADIPRLAEVAFKRFVVHLPDEFGEMHISVREEYLSELELLVVNKIHGLEFLTLGIPHEEIAAVLGWQPSTRRVHSRAANVENPGSTVGFAFGNEEVFKRNADQSVVCRQDRMFANVLLPNGDVHLCAMDYGLQHSLGNLGADTYEDVVCGDNFTQLMEYMKTPGADLLCRRCEYAVPGRYVGESQ